MEAPPSLTDVQLSGEETEWPLSFLWGTMASNESARWIGVKHQRMIRKVLLPPDHLTRCCEGLLGGSVGSYTVVDGLQSAVNACLFVITLYFKIVVRLS